MSIVRRRHPAFADDTFDPESPDNWLRFAEGKRSRLTVNPNRCPRNIAARQHWVANPADPDGLGRCLCDAEQIELGTTIQEENDDG